MAEGQDGTPSIEPTNNRTSAGQFAAGHSGNPTGRVPGVLNRATTEIRLRAKEFLSDPEYLSDLKGRLRRGEAQGVEVLLYHYAFGRPKETIQHEGEARRPFMIVLPGYGRDPLEVEAEVVDQPERKLPALPGVMPEIGFEFSDEFEEPKP